MEIFSNFLISSIFNVGPIAPNTIDLSYVGKGIIEAIAIHQVEEAAGVVYLGWPSRYS